MSNLKEWRILFHWPLPLAVVSLATFGAVFSTTIHINRLIITYLLIFFGLVLAGYSLDAMYADWRGLIKNIKTWQLIIFTIVGMTGFIGISIYAIIRTSLNGIVVALILITFLVCYNLEIPKWFHNKWGFSISWGGLTIVLSYYYQTVQLSWLIIPLFVCGFIIAIQEWYTTNMASPAQKIISSLHYNERRLLRKETFRVTSIYCYGLFAVAMTLLSWRLL